MADRTNKSSSDSDSGKNRTKNVLGTLTLILILAGICVGGFYYFNSGSFTTDTVNKAVVTEIDERTEMGPMVDIREFLVNIISEDNNHYLRTSMTVELSHDKAYNELNKRMPQIRDSILLLISNKTFDELYDSHGKKQLKAELLLTINDILTSGEATAIYFTDFVVQ